MTVGKGPGPSADEAERAKAIRIVCEVADLVDRRNLDSEITGEVVSRLAVPEVARLWLDPATSRELHRLTITMDGIRGLGRSMAGLRSFFSHQLRPQVEPRSVNRPCSEEDASDPEDAPDPATWKELITTEAGTPLARLANARRILSTDPRWLGRLRFDELAGVVRIDGVELQDVDVLRTSVWLERVYRVEWPTDKVRDAALLVAHARSYHPIREFLEGLPPWDGTPRIDDLFTQYFGVEPGPGQVDLFAAYGRSFIIGLVARALHPGSKVDHVPTLVGEQGALKSTGLRALVGDDWFSDDALPMRDPKRLGLALRGRWLIEFADLAGIRGLDPAEIRGFLTKLVDRYIPAYGRLEVVQPRGVCFSATTNEGAFLSELERRWWVMRVTRLVDVAAIRRDREQLFAEALHAYRAGVEWHLSAELERAQRADGAQYVETGEWAELVNYWLLDEGRQASVAERGFRGFAFGDIVSGALARDLARMSMDDQRALGATLRGLGWKKTQPRNCTTKRWFPPRSLPSTRV